MRRQKIQQILAIMETGVEYSTEQVAEKIGLKGPRTRQLLNELVNKELLACIGTTKRRYNWFSSSCTTKKLDLENAL